MLYPLRPVMLLGSGPERRSSNRIGRIAILLSLIIWGCVPSLESNVSGRHLDLKDADPSWVTCRDKLLTRAGIPRGVDTRYLYGTLHRDQSEVKLILAVIYVESKFRTGALSEKGAIGLMQLTDSALNDLQRRGCKYNAKKSPWDATYNVACGSCYLRSLYEETRDWTEALIIYNGGYRALTSYRKGSNVPIETAQFVLRVNQALQMCN